MNNNSKRFQIAISIYLNEIVRSFNYNKSFYVNDDEIFKQHDLDWLLSKYSEQTPELPWFCIHHLTVSTWLCIQEWKTFVDEDSQFSGRFQLQVWRCYFSVNPYDVKCVSVAEDLQLFMFAQQKCNDLVKGISNIKIVPNQLISFTLIHYSRNAVYKFEKTNHQNNNDHLSENENDWVHEFWVTDWYVIHNIKIFWL